MYWHVTCGNCEQKYSESSHVFVFIVVCFTAPDAKLHTTSCEVIWITVSWRVSRQGPRACVKTACVLSLVMTQERGAEIDQKQALKDKML